MKTLHKACVIISYVGIMNFLLFFGIALLIGGDALNGKVEAGHYYLAQGGKLIAVNYPVFMYSKLHASSLLVTHPLTILASLVYWVTGGGRARPNSLASPPQQRLAHPLHYGLHSAELLFWNVSDFIEGVFWGLFDSWRKPNIEFFTRLSKQDCIKELHAASDGTPSAYGLEKPLVGYFSGSHFYLRKWTPLNPLFRNPAYQVLSGKFSSTPHGTYVRAWHRFSTSGILFLTLWFGIVLGVLSEFLGVSYIRSAFPQMDLDLAVTIIFFAIVPALIVIILLISIWIGSRIGQATNADLIE